MPPSRGTQPGGTSQHSPMASSRNDGQTTSGRSSQQARHSVLARVNTAERPLPPQLSSGDEPQTAQRLGIDQSPDVAPTATGASTNTALVAAKDYAWYESRVTTCLALIGVLFTLVFGIPAWLNQVAGNETAKASLQIDQMNFCYDHKELRNTSACRKIIEEGLESLSFEESQISQLSHLSVEKRADVVSAAEKCQRDGPDAIPRAALWARRLMDHHVAALGSLSAQQSGSENGLKSLVDLIPSVLACSREVNRTAATIHISGTLISRCSRMGELVDKVQRAQNHLMSKYDDSLQSDVATATELLEGKQERLRSLRNESAWIFKQHPDLSFWDHSHHGSGKGAFSFFWNLGMPLSTSVQAIIAWIGNRVAISTIASGQLLWVLSILGFLVVPHEPNSILPFEGLSFSWPMLVMDFLVMTPGFLVDFLVSSGDFSSRSRRGYASLFFWPVLNLLGIGRRAAQSTALDFEYLGEALMVVLMDGSFQLTRLGPRFSFIPFHTFWIGFRSFHVLIELVVKGLLSETKPTGPERWGLMKPKIPRCWPELVAAFALWTSRVLAWWSTKSQWENVDWELIRSMDPYGPMECIW